MDTQTPFKLEEVVAFLTKVMGNEKLSAMEIYRGDQMLLQMSMILMQRKSALMEKVYDTNSEDMRKENKLKNEVEKFAKSSARSEKSEETEQNDDKPIENQVKSKFVQGSYEMGSSGKTLERSCDQTLKAEENAIETKPILDVKTLKEPEDSSSNCETKQKESKVLNRMKTFLGKFRSFDQNEKAVEGFNIAPKLDIKQQEKIENPDRKRETRNDIKQEESRKKNNVESLSDKFQDCDQLEESEQHYIETPILDLKPQKEDLENQNDRLTKRKQKETEEKCEIQQIEEVNTSCQKSTKVKPSYSKYTDSESSYYSPPSEESEFDEEEYAKRLKKNSFLKLIRKQKEAENSATEQKVDAIDTPSKISKENEAKSELQKDADVTQKPSKTEVVSKEKKSEEDRKHEKIQTATKVHDIHDGTIGTSEEKQEYADYLPPKIATTSNGFGSKKVIIGASQERHKNKENKKTVRFYDDKAPGPSRVTNVNPAEDNAINSFDKPLYKRPRNPNYNEEREYCSRLNDFESRTQREKERHENRYEHISGEAEMRSQTRTRACKNVVSIKFKEFLSHPYECLILRPDSFRLEDQVETLGMGYPLNIIFDEVIKKWIICDGKKLILFSTSNQHDGIRVIAMRDYVTGICVFVEGRSIAVLTSLDGLSCSKIEILNLEDFDRITYVSMVLPGVPDFELRGLAKSYAGNILSMQPLTIQLFKRGEERKSFELPGAAKPCYMAANIDMVAISDFETCQVFLVQLVDQHWDNIKFSVLRILSLGTLTIGKTITLPTGLQFDKLGNLLIADAKRMEIKYFDDNLNFMYNVSRDISLPYMSEFKVNSQGEMMVLAPNSSKKVRFFKITCTNLTETGGFSGTNSEW